MTVAEVGRVPRATPVLARPWGLAVKVVLLGGMDALAISVLPTLMHARSWGFLAAVVVAGAALNYVYLSRRAVPLKYLAPGTIFLLAFLVYPTVYTIYTAFTNYGTGNILTKNQAIARIESSSFTQPPGGATYQLTVLAKGGSNGPVSFLLQDSTGHFSLGTAHGRTPISASVVTEKLGIVTAVKGYDVLNLRQAQDRKNTVSSLAVPSGHGLIKAVTFGRAAVFVQTLRYDAAADTMTNTRTHVVYHAEHGTFTAANGDTLNPGWRAIVGAKNFVKAFTDRQISGPFFRVFVWTFVFAALSVFITFVVGLILAITFNVRTMHGRRIYQAIMMLPYALPSFLSALVWQGMLNPSYGVINSLFHLHVQWLLSPTPARIAVLLVNSWLGFPYWFLVITGALQAVPAELHEAARVDGASAFRIFRTVTLPLVLLSTAPLMVLAFAFNFNNFNAIYLVTGGGPPIPGAQTPAGSTDILISYTYRLAFGSGGTADYGLASAVACIIFVIVVGISLLGLRWSRRYEEIYT